MLFDFDKAISSGQTSARKALVAKALEYLNRLAAEGRDDSSIDRELVEGYLKVGDLQGNLYGPNLNDPSGAKGSYERALKIAESISPKDPKLIARAQTRLAELLVRGGAPQDAAVQFRQALKIFEAQPGERQRVMEILRTLAYTEYDAGDLQSALKHYDEGLRYALGGDAGQTRASRIGARWRSGTCTWAKCGRAPETSPRDCGAWRMRSANTRRWRRRNPNRIPLSDPWSRRAWPSEISRRSITTIVKRRGISAGP